MRPAGSLFNAVVRSCAGALPPPQCTSVCLGQVLRWHSTAAASGASQKGVNTRVLLASASVHVAPRTMVHVQLPRDHSSGQGPETGTYQGMAPGTIAQLHGFPNVHVSVGPDPETVSAQVCIPSLRLMDETLINHDESVSSKRGLRMNGLEKIPMSIKSFKRYNLWCSCGVARGWQVTSFWSWCLLLSRPL